ncbi:MAG: DUF3343 domain-containing protein [Megasphaera sp.]|jgi:hypothetical protein|nr:DUF3343 domain-containing protein [Megasphaera sp.]MCH4188063.1 DUF3343 domain-containing protein [Megasphaera sp.]
MMDRVIDYYILFKNHTDAMALFQATRQRHLTARISPTPRQASLCCGVSLLVTAADIDAVKQCIAETGAAYEKIVALPRQIDPHRDMYC